MPANINSMEVVILTDKLPRTLTALVKLPTGATRTISAYWDVAASQFEPAITHCLRLLIEDIITRHGLRTSKGQKQP